MAAPRVVGGFKAEEDPNEEVNAMATAVRACVYSTAAVVAVGGVGCVDALSAPSGLPSAPRTCSAGS